MMKRMMKRIVSIAVCMCMLLSCMQGVSASDGLGAEIAYAKGGADAIVSLTYDDGYYATASFLNKQFREKNLSGSLFLITDRLANDSYEGTLDEWKALFADGYLEPLSHSASHKYFAPSDGSYPQYEKNNTAENYAKEITGSKNAIGEYFNYTPLTMAPGGGLMSDDGFDVVKKDYYSARLTTSIGNVVKGDDVSMQTLDPLSGTAAGQWYNLKCLSVYLSGSTKRAEVLRDYVDTAVAQKGWFISYCHGICETGTNEKANNMTTDDAESFFSYISEMQKAGKVWCAGISEATKYIRERQSSTVVETGDSNVRYLNLTMADKTSDGLALDSSVFCLPLTVKARVPSSWESVKCVQNGKEQVVKAFTDRAKRYVLVDLVPNGGEAALTAASQRESGFYEHKAISEELEQFWQAEYKFAESDYSYSSLDRFKTIDDDIYEKIPVLVDTYYNEEKIAENFPDGKPPVIMYVINTNTARVGTDSDAAIVGDFINDGYIVLVCDYMNDARAVSPDLDWSIQMIRTEVLSGKYLNGHTFTDLEEVYVVPAGYRLARNVEYFNFAENGTTGCLQQIVDVWNDDVYGDGTRTGFKKVFGKKTITKADGTTVKVEDVVAETVDDCLKQDGTPIDLNLYMDIVYPTNPKEKVPVMILSSSSEERLGAWTNSIRPHLTGCLFNGYAGVVYDHAYVPMSRTDHYGYFAGETTPVYTLMLYTGVKSATAAARRLRYLADREPEKFRFDTERFGVYGHSKGASSCLLANPNPENEREQYYFEGYTEADEKADAARQPWQTYKDGSKIPSNVQMAYYSSGSGVQYFAKEGQAPTFTSCGGDDTPFVGVYPQAVNTLRKYDVPSFNMTMPNVGHTLIYGKNPKYDIDMYEAFLDFSNYWLKGENAKTEYILPLNGSENVGVTDEIRIKLSGPVSAEEIEKVSITSAAFGTEAEGTWHSEFGDTLWIFTPAGLRGGDEYSVTVPSSITAKNGKGLGNTKTVSFKTADEESCGAYIAESDSGMTLTKSAGEQNAVYLAFDTSDCLNSARTTIKFNVENDAAQSVEVYALESIDETDIKKSVLGELVDTVRLAGCGSYEADVTAWTANHMLDGKVGFALKAAKNTGETTIVDTDFDNRADVGFTTTSRHYVLNGNKCYKATSSSSAFRLAIFGYDDITEADYGRKFHISFDVLSEKDRVLSGYIGTYNPKIKLSDTEGNTQQFINAKANEWNRFDLDYTVNNPDYYTDKADKRSIYIEREGTTTNRLLNVGETLYFDNFRVTETVTDVKITAEDSKLGNAPRLVFRNSEVRSESSAKMNYVRNGEDSDKSFDGGRVSGEYRKISDGRYKKVYAKAALSEFDPTADKTNLKLNVTGGTGGKINVYGIKEDVKDIDFTKLNYINAPINDRFGSGADLSLAYGGAAIGTVNVTGAGEYTVDVKEFLSYMKENGAEYAGLILAAEDGSGEISFTVKSESEKNSKTVYSKLFSFDDLTSPLRYSKAANSEVNTQYDFTGNAPSVTSIDSTQNHGTGSGKSIKVAPTANTSNIKFYNLFDHELTTADLGRSFDVDFWVKVDPNAATNSCAFFAGLMSWNSDFGDYNVNQYGTEANGYIKKCIVAAGDTDWIKYTYSFTVEDFMLANTTDRTQNPTLFSLKFSTRCANRTFWIDDLKITETTPAGSGEEVVNIIGASVKAVSNKGVSDEKTTSVVSQSESGRITNTYAHFTGAEYKNVRYAALDMNIKSGIGGTFSIYAAANADYPENITFDNAPSLGESVGTLSVNGSGAYSVDISDFVKANPGGNYVFAVKGSGFSDREFYVLDTVAYSMSEGCDFEKIGGYGGAVSAENGGLRLSGIQNIDEGIRLMNIFGSGASASQGSYRAEAEVSFEGSGEQKIMIAAADESGVVIGEEFALTAGESQRVVLDFAAGGEDGKSINSIIIKNSSETPMSGLKINSLSISSAPAEIDSMSLRVGEVVAQSFVTLTKGESISDAFVLNSAADGSVVLCFAAYKDGKLSDCKIEKRTVSCGDNKFKVEGISYDDADGVRVMVWNNMIKMRPLCGFIVYTLN